jgi:hypothetical protein
MMQAATLRTATNSIVPTKPEKDIRAAPINSDKRVVDISRQKISTKISLGTLEGDYSLRVLYQIQRVNKGDHNVTNRSTYSRTEDNSFGQFNQIGACLRLAS